MSRLGWKEPKKDVSGYQAAGEFTPAALAGGKLAYSLGKFGVTKAADLARSLRKPEPIAEAGGLAEIGEKGFNLLSKKSEQLYKARADEAEKLYGEAFDAARKAQAQSQPFATSNAGQWLLQTLQNEKSVLAGGKEFAKGEEKVKGIDRLIDAIKGKTSGGFSREGKELPGGKIFYRSGTAPKTVEKDIEALVEELRFLRDVDAKGKPYEAYAALDASYKRDLINKLEQALYSWNPEYKVADEAYKAASRKLDPFKTQLMQGALKGEKFDPKSLVASPEEFGTKFFSDVNSVRQLKDVTQDAQAVSQLGKEYVATVLADKTPAQIKAFASNPRNKDWMKEAGIYDDVAKYAEKAVTAESRQKILKYLGAGAVGGLVVPSIGYSAYHGVRRALGL
jgi:hypothetical protein